MNTFEIYIAFVSWESSGKHRPVLILEVNANSATVFSITTHYDNKSERIRTRYFVIDEWRQAGLNKQSYIDTNNTITLPISAVDSKRPIGRLSERDEILLIKFVSQ